jgi:hypothetical protein
MKKVILLSIVAIFALSVVALATTGDSIKIFRWTPSASPATWQQVTNPVLASATGSDAWGFTLQSFPDNAFEYNNKTWIALDDLTQLGRVTWNLHVSQWIYVRIGYIDFEMHVDMPGIYTVDDLQVQVISNGGVYVYFETGGDLVNGGGMTIPTYLSYETDQDTHPDSPWTGTWNRITSLPGEGDAFKLAGDNECGSLDTTFYIWFGFDVDATTCKGDYSTYVDTFIQPDP